MTTTELTTVYKSAGVDKDYQSFVDKKQLYLGCINNAFDYKKDAILFPYTYIQLLGQENSTINLEDILTIRLFDNPEEREVVYKRCELLAHQYVEKFVSDFEREHAVFYPKKAYYLSLLPYYFTVIPFAYARYLYIKRFLKVNQGIRFYIDTFSENLSKRFKTKNELFLNLFTNLNFQDWFSSIIVENLKNEQISLRRVLGEVPILSKKDKKYNVINGLFELLKNKENWLKPHRLILFVLDQGFERIPYGFKVFQNIYGISSTWSFVYSIILNIKYLLNKKKKIKSPLDIGTKNNNKDSISIPFEQDFLEILDKIIEYTIPLTHKEAYLANVKKAQKENNYKQGRIRFDSTGFSDDFKSFRHMAAVIAGEKLIFCQHGSNYSTTKNAWASDGYEYLADYFVNWGYSIPKKKSCKFLHLPSPLLSNIADKHLEKNKYIILVGTNQRQTNDGIVIADPSYVIDYLKSKKAFIDTINITLKNQLHYRPWPTQDTDYFSDELYLKRLYPEIKILKGNLIKNLMECRLVVLDHYGTAFYEAMALNTPVIMYFGFLELEFTEEAKKIFKQLKNVGIIHDNAKSAAQLVNEIFDNVQGWWFSETVQQLRKEFCQLFALTDKKWSICWMKKLFELD